MFDTSSRALRQRQSGHHLRERVYDETKNLSSVTSETPQSQLQITADLRVPGNGGMFRLRCTAYRLRCASPLRRAAAADSGILRTWESAGMWTAPRSWPQTCVTSVRVVPGRQPSRAPMLPSRTFWPNEKPSSPAPTTWATSRPQHPRRRGTHSPPSIPTQAKAPSAGRGPERAYGSFTAVIPSTRRLVHASTYHEVGRIFHD